MATTVNNAFEEFMTNCVNLDPEIVKVAKISRDNLLQNIHDFSNDNFFNLCPEFNKQYGSFSRKTKCRELDDIDLMIGISADGATYSSIYGWNNIIIHANLKNSMQLDCSNDDGTLNSRIVLNKFKEKLKGLNDYSRSELHRDGEAINLNLISRDWAFDIVPCFHTVKDDKGESYYLIPNKDGNWKLTEPNRDSNLVRSANDLMKGNFLPLVRLCKKWAEHKKIPGIRSYLLETMLVDYALCEETSDSLKVNFINVLEFVSQKVLDDISDMKRIQGNINDLSYDERYVISEKAESEAEKAYQAMRYEIEDGDTNKAINKWREILGEDFPTYE